MNLLNNFYKRNNAGLLVLFLFVITNIVYVLMLMVTIPNTIEFANGMQLPDMMPTGYDHEYIQKLFSNLGESGRHYYLTRQIALDMVYPSLFAISYALIFTFFLNKLNQLKSPWVYLCWLPVIAGLADYLENISNIILLKNYPELNVSLIKFANFFTILKSMASTIYFLSLILLLIILGIRYLNNQRRSENKLKSDKKIAH